MDLSFLLQDLKLKFYQIMIEVARHEGSYLDICKYYRAMFDTPSVLEDKSKKHEVGRKENQEFGVFLSTRQSGLYR